MREKLFLWFKKLILIPIRILESMSKARIIKKDGKEIAIVTRDGNYISLLDVDEKKDNPRVTGRKDK